MLSLNADPAKPLLQSDTKYNMDTLVISYFASNS